MLNLFQSKCWNIQIQHKPISSALSSSSSSEERLRRRLSRFLCLVLVGLCLRTPFGARLGRVPLPQLPTSLPASSSSSSSSAADTPKSSSSELQEEGEEMKKAVGRTKDAAKETSVTCYWAGTRLRSLRPCCRSPGHSASASSCSWQNDPGFWLAVGFPSHPLRGWWLCLCPALLLPVKFHFSQPGVMIFSCGVPPLTPTQLTDVLLYGLIDGVIKVIEPATQTSKSQLAAGLLFMRCQFSIYQHQETRFLANLNIHAQRQQPLTP